MIRVCIFSLIVLYSGASWAFSPPMEEDWTPPHPIAPVEPKPTPTPPSRASEHHALVLRHPHHHHISWERKEAIVDKQIEALKARKRYVRAMKRRAHPSFWDKIVRAFASSD